MIETWKKHPKLEAEISSLQRVRTMKGKILTINHESMGKAKVNIKGKGYMLTRIIAATYIRSDLEGYRVMMKDSSLDYPYAPSNLLILRIGEKS